MLCWEGEVCAGLWGTCHWKSLQELQGLPLSGRMPQVVITPHFLADASDAKDPVADSSGAPRASPSSQEQTLPWARQVAQSLWSACGVPHAVLSS